MALIPEKIRPDDQLLLDANSNVVGLRSGRGYGDLLPPIPYIKSVIYDPPLITAGTQALTIVPMPIASMGDFVIASFSLDTQGITLSAYVNAAGSVTVSFRNGSATDTNIGSGTLSILILRNPT